MTHDDPFWGLPDPDTHGEFYEGTATKRLLAWVVDTIAIGFLTGLAVLLSAFIGLFFLPLLFGAVSLVYRIVTLTQSSATPGMQLMAIEVRTREGQRLDLSTASFHTGLYLLFFMFFPLQLISIILMLTGARGQGLHDQLLGTAVINRAGSI